MKLSALGRDLPSVLVTGANGFVGGSLVRRMLDLGVNVHGASRQPIGSAWGVISPTLGPDAEWGSLLEGKQVVIHTAARAHMLNESARHCLDHFRQVNTAGTVRLAEEAAEAGVRRFLFVSSIGVNGNSNDQPFNEADEPAPQEPYAISKYEAETALWQIGDRTGMEIVIVRPPLVYGPGAPGNFGRLMSAVSRGIPLPLGAVTGNRRTLIGLDNLVDLLATCAMHPAAANQVFLAGDDEALSTATLLKRLARAMRVPIRLVRVPVALLELAGTLVGKRKTVVQRLCGSLEVDIAKAGNLLGWSPPVSIDAGLQKAAQHFLGSAKR